MATHREQLDDFHRGLADREIARFEELRCANQLDFDRERADVPDCDGVSVHIHRPHDDKVGPYRVAAAAGIILGTAVAYKLTDMSLNSARVTVGQIVDPSEPQAAAPPPTPGAFSTLGLTLLIAAVVVGTGKIVEATLSTISRRTFFESADSWFRRIVMFGALPAAIIVLARLVKGDLAEWFLVLEGFGWAGLELAFVAVAALGWVGSVRFAWSRKYVRAERSLVAQIESLSRRAEPAVPATPAIQSGEASSEPAVA